VIGVLLEFAQPEAAELDQADGFAAAVRPFLPVMNRLAARLSPTGTYEDVVQEALLRAWAHRRQFNAARGSLLTWLLTIVAHEARRAGRRRRLPFQLTGSVHETPPEDRLDIEAATAKLPERQRLTVDCFYYVGLSVAQTAAVMGCSEGTVKSALSDARKRLRMELEAR
jgi:RNA polymerase sigma-70 factor, ECF subfamily